MKKNYQRKVRVTKLVWLPSAIICLLFILRFIIPIVLCFVDSNIVHKIMKYYQSYSMDTELCLAIIGTAIAVSVGLNIYNTIEKNELNELRLNAIKFEESIQKAREGERITFLNLLLEVHNDAMMEYFFGEFYSVISNVKMENVFDNYITELAGIQRTYSLAYEIYNSDPRGGYVRIDSLLKSLVIDADYKHELIDAYLNFVQGDMYFFMSKYKEAIKFYTRIINEYKKANYEECYIIKAYLYNSIGWCLFKTGDFSSAIENYAKMDDWLKRCERGGQINLKTNHYIWRYYNNYGVVYENIAYNKKGECRNEMQLAIDKYENAIRHWKPESGEYKVFVNYCSSRMKIWDRDCNKTSKKWKEKCQEHANDKKEDMDTCIKTMMDYLDIGQKLNPSFSDFYVQKAKLLTYQLLIKGTNDESICNEITKNIGVARQLKSSGVEYIERDFYHAMILISGSEQNYRECLVKSRHWSKKNEEDKAYIELYNILDNEIC